MRKLLTDARKRLNELKSKVAGKPKAPKKPKAKKPDKPKAKPKPPNKPKPSTPAKKKKPKKSPKKADKPKNDRPNKSKDKRGDDRRDGGKEPAEKRPEPAGCKTHSFDPSTPVLMADGTTKPIGEVAIGDEVVATDPLSGQTSAQPVTMLHLNRDVELTDVRVSSAPVRTAGKAAINEGEGDRSTRGPTVTVLHTTQTHPFWDATTGAWTDAADLVAGESTLVGPDGQVQYVVAVDNYTGTKDMRDLTVDRIHTYYVLAGDTAVLVHNNGGDEIGESCPVNWGAAEVYLDPDEGPTGHASIRIWGMVDGKGFDVHTELVGLRTARVQSFTGKLGPRTLRLPRIPLPDPEMARDFVKNRLRKPDVGRYDRNTNNCVTYAACVLRAAGYYNAPKDAGEAMPWLWNLVGGKHD